MELKVTNELKHFKATPEIRQIDNNKTEEAKLRKVSKDFESLFTSMMLKSMSKTTEGLFGADSYGGDYFGSIFMNEISSKISEGKGIGVADFIFRSMLAKNQIESIPKTENVPLKPVDVKRENMPLGKISPSRKSLERIEKYEAIIDDASRKFGIDKNLIKSVILTESAGNEKALSRANAKGLMQLMDGTASDMGVQNVWDPRENIMGGTKYLALMLRQYNGDLNLALASYNAGPGNVNKYNGIPPFEETKNYITRVIGYLNHLNNEV